MKDRRKFQRYNRQIPVKIEWEDKEIEAHLADLSMTGAGCYIAKRLPLYSDVVIHFLPEDPFSSDDEIFSCSSIVVRCCKAQNDKHYQLGLFFTHLSEEILSRIMDLAYY
ncbi:PilZ domain-containing protein [bacterium]|nr:PilZ domain-containing protein [bacterium]